MRYDRRTGETTDIKPRAGADDEPLRWNWNAPVIISPHLHTRLYFAANYLFRSDDRGNTWRKVSGNLTRQVDRNKLEVMGKVWSVDAIDKNRSTSIFGNIVALCESPLHEGRLYVGTDDGLIQVTENGGEQWNRIGEFPGVPEMTYVSAVTASTHAADTVYCAFDNHKRGDFKPYLLKSTDAGASWTSIAGNLLERGSVHCIVEDQVDPKLLFCGTEFGVYCTLDGGTKWHKLSGGMPTIAVRELEIQRRENDLVLATFGRGFFVLDDYSPLRGLEKKHLSETAHLFPIKKAWLFVGRSPLGGRGKSFQGDAFYTAPNPPVGAVFTYHVGESFKTRKQKRQASEAAARKKGDPIAYPTWNALRAEERETKAQVVLTIRGAGGDVVRRITGSADIGLHRVTWDLRHAGAGAGAGGGGRRGGSGPLVAPGTYSVSVATLIDGELREVEGPKKFEVELLPGSRFPARDPQAVLAFQKNVVELGRSVSAAAGKLAELSTRLDALDAALLQVPGTKPAWLRQARDLRHLFLDLQTAMRGDRTISRRYEATLPGIQTRVFAASASFRSTAEPTHTQRESYRIATAQLSAVLPRILKLDEQIGDLETDLEAAGGPTPPGKIRGKRGGK